MKEVTYEDWQKNPTQRLMWVWDDDEEEKEKQTVLYFINDINETFPVITIDTDNFVRRFSHCAEIEKQRQMTNKELSRRLKVILTCLKQTSYEDYTHLFKSIEIEVPYNKGEEWHVCGEEYQEQETKEVDR